MYCCTDGEIFKMPAFALSYLKTHLLVKILLTYFDYKLKLMEGVCKGLSAVVKYDKKLLLLFPKERLFNKPQYHLWSKVQISRFSAF